MDDNMVQSAGVASAVDGLQLFNTVKSWDGSVVFGRFLAPRQLCGLSCVSELDARDFIYVYYISDLHLETWYKEYCETAKEPVLMSEWIETVMDGLFSGDFLQDINNGRVFGHDFIVLFLGDIAETFAGSKLFYTAFMNRWDAIDERNRQLLERREAERQAKWQAAYDADVRIVEEYKASHPWTERAKYPLVNYNKTPVAVKDAIRRIENFGSSAGSVSVFHPAGRTVFAVLGNHEIFEFVGVLDLMDFDVVDAAYVHGKQQYKDLFQALGIHFLDTGEFLEFEQGFDIAGFCGFCDLRHFYGHVIGNYEIRCQDELALWYEKCVGAAKSKGHTLVFCTHFPLLRGTVDNVCKSNVYYFCGHTHQNEFDVLSDTGAVIADNQIGYGWAKSHKKMVFECIGLYPRYNPFGAYEDGCYEITVADYQCFYWYNKERVKTGMVERYLHGIGPFNRLFGDTGKLYMIKKCGYYGFFIVFGEIKQVHICNGGVLKQLPNIGSIEEVLAEFGVVIDAYLLVFSDFRRYQEQIASYIRSFGGDGKIHGLIVDIDYFSHVGINPVSGEITFYYSPVFGCVQNYVDMGSLLEAHSSFPPTRSLASHWTQKIRWPHAGAGGRRRFNLFNWLLQKRTQKRAGPLTRSDKITVFPSTQTR